MLWLVSKEFTLPGHAGDKAGFGVFSECLSQISRKVLKMHDRYHTNNQPLRYHIEETDKANEVISMHFSVKPLVELGRVFAH